MTLPGQRITWPFLVILYLYSDRWVKIMFITSLILDEFSCGKVQIPRLCKQQMTIEAVLICGVVFYITSSKDFLSFLEVVWEIQRL